MGQNTACCNIPPTNSMHLLWHTTNTACDIPPSNSMHLLWHTTNTACNIPPGTHQQYASIMKFYYKNMASVDTHQIKHTVKEYWGHGELIHPSIADCRLCQQYLDCSEGLNGTPKWLSYGGSSKIYWALSTAIPKMLCEISSILDTFDSLLHCHTSFIETSLTKTSQELRMLSSVTLNCQVTKIVMNSGSQLP